MVYMALGDVDPKTVALQILLNRIRTSPEFLDVDGTYGPETEQAVRNFQGSSGLEQTGAVDSSTWLALTGGRGLASVDVIDGSAADAPRVSAGLRAAGSEPVVAGGPADSIETEMRRIAERAQNEGFICLLRFRTSEAIFRTCSKQSIFTLLGHTGAPIAAMRARHLLSYISEHLVPFSSIEIHGCTMGQAEVGRAVLRVLADTWGVPVTAPIRKPPDGAGLFWTHRFEGWAFTAYPGGGNLMSWASRFSTASQAGTV